MDKFQNRIQGEEDTGFMNELSPEQIEQLLAMAQKTPPVTAPLPSPSPRLNRSPMGMGESRDVENMMGSPSPSLSPSPYESSSPSATPDLSDWESAVISTSTPYPRLSPERTEQMKSIAEKFGIKDYDPNAKAGQYPEPIGPRPSKELQQKMLQDRILELFKPSGIELGPFNPDKLKFKKTKSKIEK